jgi:hypothetical protein
MADAPHADEQRLEEIVAYLDGELSPEESARVERQLASDDSYRRQLQGVERAWKALDELPMPVVDDQFSRSTMALAVQAATAEVQEKTVALPIQRRRSWLATGFTAAAAAALGFLVIRLAWQNPERMLLHDLAVIDNVDVYSQVDRVDYLRLLRRELGPQLDELGLRSTAAPEELERLHTVMQVNLRAGWLRKLDPVQRTDLRAKYNRFRELPVEEQQRLRKLHEELAAAPDADELQRTMFTYHEWLRGLPPARQFELRSMPAEDRVRTVSQWASEMRDDAIFALSEDELRIFVRKMRVPLNDLMRTAARDMLREPQGRRPPRFAEPPGPNLPRALALQFASGVVRPGEFQNALLEALPERTRGAFERLPPREKVERVMAWKRQAEAAQGEVSQEALERFFAEELDPETRAELLSLPPGDMQQALGRLYRRQMGRGFDGPGAWGRRDGRGDAGERRPPERRPGERGDRPRSGFGPPVDGPRGFGPPREPRRGDDRPTFRQSDDRPGPPRE